MNSNVKLREKNKAHLSLSAAMLIFGSIGIFRRYLAVPSGFLVLSRAVIGALFLLFLTAIRGHKFSACAIKRNFLKLLCSGTFLGINWILLFEAYNRTEVSVATLCYYMAPVFIITASPVILKERLTAKKLFCAAGSLFGMVLVSGLFTGGVPSGDYLAGILLGLASAVFYASVVLLNKKLTDIEPYDKTFVQLTVSAAVVLPYVLVFEDVSSVIFDVKTVLLLGVVGIVHTGIAYALYFGALKTASAQSAALLSYIDPASALIMSAVILGERLDLYATAGAALILLFALFGEFEVKHSKGKTEKGEA